MLLVVWIAFAAGIIAFAAGLTLAVTRGFRAWRTFRRLTRNVTRRLEELTSKVSATEQKAAAAGGSTAKLADAAAHLHESLTELAVLRAALDEATSNVGRARSAVPRK